jgi:hypothetical protein
VHRAEKEHSMKYHTYVAPLVPDASADTPPIPLSEWLSAVEDSLEGEGVDLVISADEKVGGVQSYVMVSRDTLARLGVLDKIETIIVGASFPSAKPEKAYTSIRMHHDTRELGAQSSFRVELPQPLNTSQKSPPKLTPWKSHIVHVGGINAADMGTMAPLFFEVEDQFLGEGVVAGQAPLSDSSVNAFVRLHAVLGDVVSQASATPEVIEPEDDRFQLLEAKDYAARLDATDQTVYNWEKAGRLISVLPPGRVRSRRYPAFQLSPRLNRPLHELAIAMYRSHEQDMTLYWDFLRSRHKDFGGSTGVDFLLNRVAEPGLLDLEESDLNDLFLSVAEEDMSRAIS